MTWHPNISPIFLLLYAITNEKTFKFTQIGRLLAACIFSLQKLVPTTLVETSLFLKIIYLLLYIYDLGSYGENWRFLVISIVIDSDRGHCYEHLKKNR